MIGPAAIVAGASHVLPSSRSDHAHPLAGATPPGFVFALKAPREITHERRLAGIAGAVRSLYLSAAELEEKLGPVLFQLPPTLEKDVPLLRELLAEVPRGGRTAVELRHPSWRDDAVLEAMRDAGAALCIVDGLRGATPLVRTARFGYLRLQRPRYDERALALWLDRIRAEPWEEAFVYFKHTATAPAHAEALARLVDSPDARWTTPPPSPAPSQP